MENNDFKTLRFEDAICSNNTTSVKLKPEHCKFSENYTDVVIREISPVFTRTDEASTNHYFVKIFFSSINSDENISCNFEIYPNPNDIFNLARCCFDNFDSMISFNIYSLVDKKLVVLARQVTMDSNTYMQLDSFYNTDDFSHDCCDGYGLEYEEEE